MLSTRRLDIFQDYRLAAIVELTCSVRLEMATRRHSPQTHVRGVPDLVDENNAVANTESMAALWT